MSPNCLKLLAAGSCLAALSFAAAGTATPSGGAGGTSDTATPVVTRADPSHQQSAELAGLGRIEALIGDAACRNSQDCRVIGIGARACGGPEVYRAWSSWRTSEAALQKLVSDDAAARRRQLDEQGMVSTCAIVPTPSVACSLRTGAFNAAAGAGICTLQPTAPGL